MVKQLSIFSSNTSEMFGPIAPKSKNAKVKFIVMEKTNVASLLFVRIIFTLSGII